MSKGTKIAVVVGAVLLVGSIFAAFDNKVGSVGTLCKKEDGNILVATSRDGWQAMVEAVTKKDKEGFMIYMIQHGAFLPKNTKVRVIDQDYGIFKIRVLDENSPNWGRTYWTLRDWVCLSRNVQ